jgi:hypothetical protein
MAASHTKDEPPFLWHEKSSLSKFRYPKPAPIEIKPFDTTKGTRQ